MAAAKDNGVVEKVVDITEQPKARVEVKVSIITPVSIDLDPESDVVYRMRMTNKATRIIDEMTGINIWQGIGDINNVKAHHLCVMVWACLLWEHPTLTLEKVEEMPGMDAVNFVYIITRLDKLLTESTPVADPNAKSDPNASPSVGSTTGQSDA